MYIYNANVNVLSQRLWLLLFISSLFLCVYLFFNWCNWSIELNMWSVQISSGVQIVQLKFSFRDVGTALNISKPHPWVNMVLFNGGVWRMREMGGNLQCNIKFMDYRRNLRINGSRVHKNRNHRPVNSMLQNATHVMLRKWTSNQTL